jgi:hypothetical protein
MADSDQGNEYESNSPVKPISFFMRLEFVKIDKEN